MNKYDVIIVGGGLSGLTSAIALSKLGYSILLFEINTYPHHKVCGEYISSEIYPYLKSLGIDLLAAGAVPISNFEISTVSGKKATAELPLGGLGLSRFTFDELLYQKAKAQNVAFKFSKVTNISFENNKFQVESVVGISEASIVLGAYGKRATLDKSLKRSFSAEKQDWLAVKAHYTHNNFPDNLVALHNFEGGYGGLSKTETGAVNFCYLTNYKSFKRFNDISSFNKKIVSKNPYLQDFFEQAVPIFETPMAIAQFSFQQKKPVENHILMCGDTAGLIHPLCGNGMAMAIHSAKLAAALMHNFFQDKDYTRARMEEDYSAIWKSTFSSRLWFGRKLQHVLLNKWTMEASIHIAATSNSALTYAISKTHGKTIM